MKISDGEQLHTFNFKRPVKAWSFPQCSLLKCSADVWIGKQQLWFCFDFCTGCPLYLICWTLITNLPASKKLVSDCAEIAGFPIRGKADGDKLELGSWLHPDRKDYSYSGNKELLFYWVFGICWLTKSWRSVCVMTFLFWARELRLPSAGLTQEGYLLSDFSSLGWKKNPFPSFIFISPFTTCCRGLFGLLASVLFSGWNALVFISNCLSGCPSLTWGVCIQLIHQEAEEVPVCHS